MMRSRAAALVDCRQRSRYSSVAAAGVAAAVGAASVVPALGTRTTETLRRQVKATEDREGATRPPQEALAPART